MITALEWIGIVTGGCLVIIAVLALGIFAVGMATVFFRARGKMDRK